MRFADTSYFLARLNPRDQWHEQARLLSRDRTVKIITTTWVLVELANATSTPPLRQRYVDFAREFIQVARKRIVPANEDWFSKGFDLYRRRPDKEWSLTDCISFLVMQDLNITEALTADHHFTQAGFQVLLQN